MVYQASPNSQVFTKTKHNIGLKILEIIGERLQYALRKYCSGNVSGWFFDLKAVKIMVIAHIPEPEKKILKLHENKIVDLINRSKKDPKLKVILCEAVEEYNDKIQTILFKLNIGIPTKQARYHLFGQKENSNEIVSYPEEEFDGN